MSNHLSQNDLDKLYKKESKKIGKTGIDQLNVGNKRPGKKDIFLCHSHLDKTIVAKLTMLFKSLDVNLYIDWMDIGMPELTDRNTAKIIKTKIDSAEKFIFLATYHAIRSKWCNWELGLAYSSKGENDFAILPIESRSGNWKGSEYLQLYPEMQINLKDNNFDLIKEGDIKINFYDLEVVNFKEWMQPRK